MCSPNEGLRSIHEELSLARLRTPMMHYGSVRGSGNHSISGGKGGDNLSGRISHSFQHGQELRQMGL